MIRPGIDVFGIIAYSTGLIVGFGSVGAVIGLGIAFATMSSEMASAGLIGLLIIMLIGGIGMVVGAAIGIVVAIIIGLKSTPNKTKGDYFKIIGIPLAIVLIIVLWFYVPILRDEYQDSREYLSSPAPAAPAAPLQAPPTPLPAIAISSFYVACDDFLEENHLELVLHVQSGSPIKLVLCSNPTTGFVWSREPQISDEAILRQTGVWYTAASSNEVGAAGTAVWIFESLTTGTSSVLLEYSRPWEGGEKIEWSLTATIIAN